MKLKYADLFCGCGGLSYGFEHNNKYECVLATDNWETAGETYSINYKNNIFNLKDMYKDDDKEYIIRKIKNCDVIIGGPPCQGFSTLGKRSIDNKKCTLVDSFSYVITNVKPKIVLMENVKGFVSKKHPNGGLYPDVLINALKNCMPSYNIWSGLLDFYSFGMAQTRTRFIFIATRSDLGDAVLKNIVNYIHAKKATVNKTLFDVIGDLPDVKPCGGSQIFKDKHNKYIYNHQSLNHSEVLQERFSYVPPGGGLLDVPKNLLTNHLKKLLDGKYGSGGFVKNIYGRLEWNKPCGTIVAGIDKITCGRFVHPVENRLLTPRECARIQGYPDTFKFLGGLVAQYYQIGNSVPPVMSKIFASAIIYGIKQL